MPCGACREFLLELNAENKEAEFMMNYETRKTIKVAELIPYWWGEERAINWQDKQKESVELAFSFIFQNFDKEEKSP